jgi:hypothetical protein
LHTMQGPITWARAWQLDLQVRSNLINCFSELTLGSMHLLLIRNNGEDQQGLGEGQGVKEQELGCPHQGGVHVQLDFDSTSDSRNWLHQNWCPGHIRSRISTFYIWLEPEFHRSLNSTVPPQNSFWVDGNHRHKWASRICQSAVSPSVGPMARVPC